MVLRSLRPCQVAVRQERLNETTPDPGGPPVDVVPGLQLHEHVALRHPDIVPDGLPRRHADSVWPRCDSAARSRVAARTPLGGRAATSTFIQNQIGDVLVTFENEAEMIAREFGRGGFEVVYPSVSAEAEPPVTVVDKVVDRKGSRAIAEAYLKYLWSDEAQRIAANNYLRPRNQEILAEFADRFPKVDFMPVEATFGSWPDIQKA